ncbi:hypothetical protein GCM10010302_75340 [Streptomyces polychromogenes]|uniref:Uncharacterized protein n=1 Tax=Streptomyces polychromogenes TaxID=67342 RepID=A0ABN0W4T2_9ACTN
MERQTTTLRTLTCRAFPEPDAPDDASAPIEQARAQRHRQAGATEAAAGGSRRPLWYDGDAAESFSDFVRFGGWTTPNLKLCNGRAASGYPSARVAWRHES